MIYPDVQNLTENDLKVLCEEYRKNNFINPEINASGFFVISFEKLSA